MIIYKSTQDGLNKIITILGIRIYKRSQINFKKRQYCQKSYFYSLLKTIENDNEKYYYFLNILIWKIAKTITYQKQIAQIYNRIQDMYYDMHVLNQVQILHKPYLKYKRINEGKEVVLVATGPTSNYYTPIKGAIHVGVNAAIYFEDIKFDYLFANDYFKNNSDLNDDIDKYEGNNCQKFFAIPSPHRLKINQDRKMPIDRHPQYRFYNQNVLPYCLLDSREYRWAVNLECEPFGDIGGSVYSALQFICYTNPKRIYIVGCDCSNSYSISSGKVDNAYKAHKTFWTSFKTFINTVYPNTEIVSINPIGLYGMFSDVFTQNYIVANPNIKEELGDNITLLEDTNKLSIV